MPTLIEALQKSEAYLKERGIDRARTEAQEIFQRALGLTKIQLYLKHDLPFSADELERVRPLVARRGRREPLQWILGETGFYAHDFRVRPGVLCPRPDTETLVDAALALIPEGDGDPFYVADLGSGTGCVGLSLAAARPRVRLYAVDLSDEALACTRENTEKLGLKDRVAVLRGDLLGAVPPGRPVDLVVSNPPYVLPEEIDAAMPEVRDWEPRLALDGGPDGLDVYRRLIPQAAARARVGLAVEIGHAQGPAVIELFAQAGLRDLQLKRDLGQRDRVVLGRRPEG
jgi:release factor glutamine methyltransferase